MALPGGIGRLQRDKELVRLIWLTVIPGIRKRIFASKRLVVDFLLRGFHHERIGIHDQHGRQPC